MDRYWYSMKKQQFLMCVCMTVCDEEYASFPVALSPYYTMINMAMCSPKEKDFILHHRGKHRILSNFKLSSMV